MQRFHSFFSRAQEPKSRWLLLAFLIALLPFALNILLSFFVSTAQAVDLNSLPRVELPTAATPTAPKPSPIVRFPSSTGTPIPKAELLKRLRDLQARQTQVLDSLNDLITKKLQSSTALNIREQETHLAKQKVLQFSLSMQELLKRRQEFTARRDFVDQLILQFDTKWSTQPLKPFLEQQLLEMALTDLSDPRNTGQLWKFLTYLSIAVREIPEPREDVLGLVEGFMNFGGVLEPGNPADYLASRQYTDGILSATAKPFPRENLGEYLEKRERELGLIKEESQQVRMKAPATPSNEKVSSESTSGSTQNPAQNPLAPN